MIQARFTVCKRCGDTFDYVPTARRAPIRKYCDRCAPIVKRDGNRARVAAYRARIREAAKTSQKQPSDNPPRPVAIGRRGAVARPPQPAPKGGLYADVPDPGRTAKRKAIGLP